MHFLELHSKCLLPTFKNDTIWFSTGPVFKLKVEYHANTKYKNPLQIYEKK